MDEPGTLILYPTRRSLLVFTGRLFLLILLNGCTSPEPKFTVSAAPNIDFSETVKNVSRERGLAPTQEIIFAPGGDDASGKAASLARIEIYNGAPLGEVERIYKDIGLLPDGIDLAKALAEFRRLEQLIRYDRAKASVSWSSNAARLGAPLVKLDSDKARDLAPVFAIVQALQEQHFEWRAIIDKLSLEDRRSAFRAVAAGDALLTLIARGMPEDAAKLWRAMLEASDSLAAEYDKLAIALPSFLRRQLVFPYRRGGEFVYWAFRSRGWPGVNALYASPPLSTAEILHPQRFYIERESQLRFFPPHLLRRFKSGAVVEQTLGEDTIAGLLADERPASSAADTAAAWRGDQLFAFREGAHLTTAWFSSWRTENQAEEFLRAYRALLESRHGVRFNFSAAQNSAALTIARAPDQRGWLIQRNKSAVLLVSASPATRLLELASDAWKDLEIENERMEIRFESAQLRGQFSVRSK